MCSQGRRFNGFELTSGQVKFLLMFLELVPVREYTPPGGATSATVRRVERKKEKVDAMATIR